MQNGCNENERLRDEIDNLTIQINDLNKSINELSAKYRSLKERKDRKVFGQTIFDDFENHFLVYVLSDK